MFNLEYFLVSLFTVVESFLEKGENSVAYNYCDAMVDSLPLLHSIGHITSQELRTALTASCSCQTVVQIADMGGDAWEEHLRSVKVRSMRALVA
jgi:hypothetical protein